ncbi:UpxY family transcription antiterminator [Bacteroides sp.]
MSDIQNKWFAARVRDKQEFFVRDRIEKMKTENGLGVECYLPTKIVVRQLKYRRKRVEIPLIKNLLFIRCTKQTALDLANRYGIPLFYMKDLFTHNLLVVPDKQMDDFRFMLDLSPDAVSFDNSSLVVGSKVKVIKGEFAGVEGLVGTESNRTYVVIRIHGILTASIKIPKSYLKPIE